MRWLNPDQVDAIELAPLTKEEVLPLARVGWRAESQREGNVVEIILKTFEMPHFVWLFKPLQDDFQHGTSSFCRC